LFQYSGVSALEFIRYVKHEDRAAYVTKMRGAGPDFVNFTINNRDENNRLFEAPSAPEYYVIEHVAPLATNRVSLGYNCLSSPLDIPVINRIHETGVDGATAKFKLVQGVYGIIYFSPIYSLDRKFIGLANSILYIDQLFKIAQMVSGTYLTMIGFDRNVSAVNDEASFMYSTSNDGKDGFAEAQQLIANSPYTTNGEVLVGGRTWSVTFVPSAQYIFDYRGWEKWISLFSSLVIAIILMLIISIIIKRMQHKARVHQLNRERVDTLRQYLDQISSQEQQMRSTLDAIPDLIIVIDSQGKILQTNASFDRIFTNMTENKLREGVYVTSLLCELPPKFFIGIVEQMETVLKKPAGTIPVAVTVRPLIGAKKSQTELEDVQTYLVVIRNMMDRVTLMEQLAKQQDEMKKMSDMMWFDAKMEDIEFRRELHEYCREELNEENMLFLDEVAQYKKQTIEDRIATQKVIFDTYIKIGAPRQLNIDRNLSMEMAIKLEKSYGNVNIFDKVVSQVKSILILDVIPRFKKANSQSLSNRGNYSQSL
jgi:CHASE1-domain containing sensor protein